MINNKNVEEKIVDSFTKIMWSEEYKDLKFLKFVILFEYIGIFISFWKNLSINLRKNEKILFDSLNSIIFIWLPDFLKLWKE